MSQYICHKLQPQRRTTSVARTRASKSSLGPCVLSFCLSLSRTTCIQEAALSSLWSNSTCSRWVMVLGVAGLDGGRIINYYLNCRTKVWNTLSLLLNTLTITITINRKGSAWFSGKAVFWLLLSHRNLRHAKKSMKTVQLLSQTVRPMQNFNKSTHTCLSWGTST